MGTRVGSVRAYRVSTTRSDAVIGTGAPAEYVDVFGVPAPGTALSPEQWARTVFEDAPRPLRWMLLVGWRAGLGLRLGPRRSPAHVLGWRILATEPDVIRLELRSALMTNQLRLLVDRSELRLTTAVVYRVWGARTLWAAAGPIHRRVVPYLLGRAAARPRRST